MFLQAISFGPIIRMTDKNAPKGSKDKTTESNTVSGGRRMG